MRAMPEKEIPPARPVDHYYTRYLFKEKDLHLPGRKAGPSPFVMKSDRNII